LSITFRANPILSLELFHGPVRRLEIRPEVSVCTVGGFP
jgi:hypothetical protein